MLNIIFLLYRKKIFYIFVNIFLNDNNSYSGKYCSFQSVILSYIEIFQCENKFTMFIQRITVPDVSMTVYAGFDEEYGTKTGLSMGVNLTLTRRYDQLVISYPEDKQ